MATISFEPKQTTNYLSENALRSIEQFELETEENENTNFCTCCNQWWNCKYKHQRFIINIVERTSFHIGIIILVLIDCLLVIGELMLDFIYLNEKCNDKKRVLDNEEIKNPRLELAIEVLHYGSIILLCIFVFEVIIKIYAFGRKWWDFDEKKMEWLDAIIVMLSFIVDIYFLKRPNVIAEISLLFISLRLWRIIRIVNSVAQSVRSKDEQSKKHLTDIYTQIVQLLLDVSIKKTDVISEIREDLTVENFDKLIEKFTAIDQSCRSILTHHLKPSSRHTLTDVAQNLQETLEHIRSSTSRLTVTDESKT